MNWLIIIIYVLLSVGGQLAFKMGAGRNLSFSFSKGAMQISLNWLCIAGAVCYVGSFLLYLYLISKYNLNKIIPLLIGMTYILTLGASVFILREKLTMLHGIGIAVIFIGVLMVIS